jgi:CDP-diacylglycerol--glycerol-3-phosphate 3-phosphatidyltransferase
MRENLFNVPNPVTATRIILAIAIVILFFLGHSLLFLLWLFLIAAFTDFLDGFLARRLKQETLFGARFDILADRILWVSFGIVLILGYKEYNFSLFLLSMIFLREIICGIFLAGYIIFSKRKKFIPYVRIGGKINTLLQGIAIPSMILSNYYSVFEFYKLLAILCAFFGVVNAVCYIFDIALKGKLKNSYAERRLNQINPIAPASYRN